VLQEKAQFEIEFGVLQEKAQFEMELLVQLKYTD